MIKKNIQQLQRPHWSGLLDRVEKIEEGYVNLDRNEISKIHSIYGEYKPKRNEKEVERIIKING